MITRKTEQKAVEVIESVTCNKCGESCVPDGTTIPHGLIDAAVDGGYYSTHLEDAKLYKFDLCEKCLVELFHTFKIAPDEHHHDSYGLIV